MKQMMMATTLALSVLVGCSAGGSGNSASTPSSSTVDTSALDAGITPAVDPPGEWHDAAGALCAQAESAEGGAQAGDLAPTYENFKAIDEELLRGLEGIAPPQDEEATAMMAALDDRVTAWSALLLAIEAADQAAFEAASDTRDAANDAFREAAQAAEISECVEEPSSGGGGKIIVGE